MTANALRILIVDDSALTRSLVKRSIAMSDVPADVAEAGDGLAALEQLRAKTFDICFLDLNMPRMGGVEVARTVFGDPKLTTRVVIVSSEAMAGKIKDLQEAGVSGYIRKPFQPEAIREVLCRLSTEDTKRAA
jgi:CheY-like chemotaxis protein